MAMMSFRRVVVVQHRWRRLTATHECQPVPDAARVARRHRDSPYHQLHDVAVLVDLLFPEHYRRPGHYRVQYMALVAIDQSLPTSEAELIAVRSIRAGVADDNVQRVIQRLRGTAPAARAGVNVQQVRREVYGTRNMSGEETQED